MRCVQMGPHLTGHRASCGVSALVNDHRQHSCMADGGLERRASACCLAVGTGQADGELDRQRNLLMRNSELWSRCVTAAMASKCSLRKLRDAQRGCDRVKAGARGTLHGCTVLHCRYISRKRDSNLPGYRYWCTPAERITL